ncbi:MAG: radical SAM/SPASM domain-containing protein [Thermoanaerobaculia bacterium]
MQWLRTAEDLLEQYFAPEGYPRGCVLKQEKDQIRARLERRIKVTQSFIEEKVVPPVYRTPLTVQMELTHRCNLRCLMCYNRSGSDPVGYVELSDDEWMEQARQFLALGVCEVIISGGEPFLRPRLLLRLLDLFKERGAIVHLITNGWLVTPELAGRLATYRFGFIQVSIDGHVPAIHDRIRQVPGSWQRATRTLQMLSSQGLPCRIAHTIVKENYQALPEMVDLSIFLGAKAVVLGRVLAQGRGCENHDSLALGPEESEEFYALFQKEKARKSAYLTLVLGMETHQQIMESYIMPNRAIILRPNGDVRLGCLAPFAYGNVRERSLKEIWEQGAARGYLHPEVVTYIRDILTEGEAEAVRRLGLGSEVESRFLRHEEFHVGADSLELAPVAL